MTSHRAHLIACLCILSLFPQHGISSSLPSWNDGAKGATKDYYNSAAKLPWDRALGDWTDADGTPWGKKPYSSLIIANSASVQTVSIDVTNLVTKWLKREIPNQGFYLIAGSAGIAAVNSREANERQPRLRIVDHGGSTTEMIPVYDTVLDMSTVASLGHQKTIKISSETPALIWYDLATIPTTLKIDRVYLDLSITKMYGSGPIILNAYRTTPAPETSKVKDIQNGVASEFASDTGISEHPSVYFSTGFEEHNWQRPWLIDGSPGKAGAHKDFVSYEPMAGRSLAATIPQGKNMGLNIRYRFTQNGYDEPEEAFFRYYIRLDNSWNQTVSGGKLPGFAGTYDSAGWGSRRPDGSNGWSARGGFLMSIGPSAAGEAIRTPIGSYVYHLDQEGYWGNSWSWSSGSGALLENNRWYCIEQYIKLNTVGESDGVLKAWVDGRAVFEKQALRFRTSSKLKIQDVWFNIYHGGSAPSPRDQTVFIDNVVISREYIGPINQD